MPKTHGQKIEPFPTLERVEINPENIDKLRRLSLEELDAKVAGFLSTGKCDLRVILANYAVLRDLKDQVSL